MDCLKCLTRNFATVKLFLVLPFASPPLTFSGLKILVHVNAFTKQSKLLMHCWQLNLGLQCSLKAI